MTTSDHYNVPAGIHRFEEEIQRSRFITTLAPAATVAEAVAFIDSIRAEFPDATHNCWAYLVGPPGSSTHVGMSDDGEPHGTAGRPMLQVLTHCEIGDIAAVVTRYYGGTKLGKGGLARAYSGGVQKALAELPPVEKVTYSSLVVTVPYNHISTVQQCAGRHRVVITAEEYAAEARFSLDVPRDKMAGFRKELTSLTAACAHFQDEA
ncbi:MAG: YigZ family protein [Acidobacteriota bacterium]|nr:YigZ family protein [Acidobacteriota bacterium]